MPTIAERHHDKPGSMARIIIASSAGTAFEWYDFFIFGSLAPVISKVFFAGLEPSFVENRQDHITCRCGIRGAFEDHELALAERSGDEPGGVFDVGQVGIAAL